MRRLADHAIARHAPEAADAAHPHLALLRAVIEAQASLVARWMLVGFVHGVMNTDNMTISGETIDYGPCAFMEGYDPETVFSSIDERGRYAYGNQPAIAEWNLTRLAEAMLPLLAEREEEAVALAVEALDGFVPSYRAAWSAGMRAKLGLAADVDADAASLVVDELLALMGSGRVDLTSCFRALGSLARGGDPTAPFGGDVVPLRDLFVHREAFDAWAERWRALAPDADAMDRVNPVSVPRNHLVEEALTAAVDGDMAPFEQLLEAVTAPFEERPGLARCAAPGPERSFRAYRTSCGT